MPFPYFENISTDFTGKWSSPRNRKATEEAVPSQPTTTRRKAPKVVCPHSMTIVRSSRHRAATDDECPICLEKYFVKPADREKISPAKMSCSHVFCHECIETHLSSSITCPLPWCEVNIPLQPDHCDLCKLWQRDHAARESLVVTVRASEMFGSIRDALSQIAAEDDFYVLTKVDKDRFFAHVSATLKRFEWQYHSDIDLAELLDPFLLAVDQVAAREHYGSKLSSPPPAGSSHFPPREHDPDDYADGTEPWIAAFLRQWAEEYVSANGEVKEGWGVWANKPEEDDSSWEWPYKRVIAHKMSPVGQVQYLVKWVGQRYPASWVEAEQLDPASRAVYDGLHGVNNGPL